MGYFHYALGIATILIVAIVWGVLNYATAITSDIFYNITPSHVGNYTVNQTEVRAEFTVVQDVFFYFIFFIVIIALIWIIRKTTTEKESGTLGYS